jgi:hypothetical protein
LLSKCCIKKIRNKYQTDEISVNELQEKLVALKCFKKFKVINKISSEDVGSMSEIQNEMSLEEIL